MSVDTHIVFAMSNIRCDWGDKFLHESVNGLLRGLCIVGPAPEGAQIRKFAIDATGERCVGVVGRPGPFWPDAELPNWDVRDILKFDGSRGRIFYTKDMPGRAEWSVDAVAVAVDLE